MTTEPVEVPTCSVCRTYLRGTSIPLGVCAQCDLVANPPKPCRCGHLPAHHHDGGCFASRWDYAARNRLGCGCTEYEEAA